MNPILVSSLPARSFIDPANYCQPFSGKFFFFNQDILFQLNKFNEITKITELGLRFEVIV